ncbi:hypothetical protein Hanom_Chr00s000002g01598891 [Helianthus anomalus]
MFMFSNYKHNESRATVKNTEESPKLYFLIWRFSKLWRSGSSRPLFVARASPDGFVSWPSCALDALDTTRLDGAPDDPGLVPERTAYFEKLPFRDALTFSESACCKQHYHNKCSERSYIGNFDPFIH